MMLRILLAFGILIQINQLAFAGCSGEINQFLIDKKIHNKKEIEDIKKVMDDKCVTEIKNDTKTLKAIRAHVSEGMDDAVYILARVIRNLDGGELEDARRAIGDAIDVNPTMIFKLYTSGIISEYDFDASLRYFPDKYTDNPKGVLEHQRHRLGLIIEVKGKDLQPAVERAKEILAEQITQIESSMPTQ